MKNKQFLKLAMMACVGLPLVGFVSSCEDDLADDDHYKAPSFLKGNAIEVLQKDGNHSIFLKGIDLIGYSDIVDSQILTVFAPNDDAFNAYLQKRGYTSIEEMYEAEPAYLNKVITYHLLYYAMDWSKMTNFRPNEGDGATEAERAVLAGMYHRFRTRCADPVTTEFNNDPAINDSVKVFHFERMVPVFSSQMFATLGLAGREKYNYEYLFPNSTWNPNNLADGFNIANAAVLDTVAVVTDNGYLYHVDQVIEPLNTINEELRTNEAYSIFYNLYDDYSYYVEDVTESANLGYVVYNHMHEGLPNIALEWSSSSFLAMEQNMSTSYNVFAPTNAAMDKMFQDFWDADCGYANVNDLNPLILSYFIRQSFSGELQKIGEYYIANHVCFPDYIKSGTAKTGFDTPINIDVDNVSDLTMCCNGILYGADNMDVPLVFSSVVGPAFKDVRYLPYLYALDASGLMFSLASQESEFVSLIPDTAQFTYDQMRLFTPLTGGLDILQNYVEQEGAWMPVSSSAMTEMVNMHIAANVSELPSKGVHVIETNTSFNYWYVVDGRITTNALFNQQLNPEFNDIIFSPFTEIVRGDGEAWNNGKAYAYQYPGIFDPADASQTLERELSINNDRNYPYYVFSQLLRLAGLASDGLFASGLMLDPESPRFIAMVPTNEALKACLNELPGCAKLKIDDNFKISGSATKATLSAYLLSYFITADRNAFTAYPYVGSPTHGVYDTGGDYAIQINDDGSALSVNFVKKDISNDVPESNVANVVADYRYLPFAFSDGCFHLIDGVLK